MNEPLYSSPPANEALIDVCSLTTSLDFAGSKSPVVSPVVEFRHCWVLIRHTAVPASGMIMSDEPVSKIPVMSCGGEPKPNEMRGSKGPACSDWKCNKLA